MEGSFGSQPEKKVKLVCYFQQIINTRKTRLFKNSNYVAVTQMRINLEINLVN